VGCAALLCYGLKHQPKAQAVVVGNPDRNVLGQVHNTVPIDQF
jgi:hypothetical protein